MRSGTLMLGICYTVPVDGRDTSLYFDTTRQQEAGDLVCRARFQLLDELPSASDLLSESTMSNAPLDAVSPEAHPGIGSIGDHSEARMFESTKTKRASSCDDLGGRIKPFSDSSVRRELFMKGCFGPLVSSYDADELQTKRATRLDCREALIRPIGYANLNWPIVARLNEVDERHLRRALLCLKFSARNERALGDGILVHCFAARPGASRNTRELFDSDRRLDSGGCFAVLDARNLRLTNIDEA